ncbi:MAG: hypothetical protein LLG04_13420 [Parachlamydia sp.]|nr:hypothetical protein [Parachlamydia sp.]
MQDRRDSNLPDKVNRILNIILIALLLIVLRVWHLEVVQYDEKLEQSLKPQHRTILEPARRGTIRDRFNQPLAVNTMKYNAAILYSELRQVPAVVWEKGADGKKVRRFKRREYIKRLAELLGDELQLDAQRIEDLVHAKATFYYQMPFLIKEDITEKEYYRLKMLEKDWRGIHVQQVPRRSYPRGKVGADVVGYMGAINREEYERILHEIADVEAFLENCSEAEDMAAADEAKEHLMALKEQAYSIHDAIGKSGIESSCERLLRGYHGRKTYYSDAKGNFLKEMDAKEPLAGERVLLGISADLQEYAEKLLAQNEQIRMACISNNDALQKSSLSQHQPWIKGGAIVALDPNTGEILALASYPRFDPNDFVQSAQPDVSKAKRQRIGRWLESEQYLADIWDQKLPLERERYDDKQGSFFDEAMWLTWDNYLRRILPKEHPVILELQRMGTIEATIALQRNVEQSDDYDKLLLLDLSRLCVDETRFSAALIQKKGKATLSDYRQLCGAKVAVEEVVKGMAADLFREIHFRPWREKYEKLFLKEKRAQEKAANSYQKPYTDYLDAAESEMFKAFWERYHWSLLETFLTGKSGPENDLEAYEQHFIAWHREISQGAHPDIGWREKYLLLQRGLNGLDSSLAVEYLKTMRGYRELDRPLLGRYRPLRVKDGVQLERHLAAAFYPKHGFGYGRSQAFRQAAPQGSIFKLVTAYAALIQRYQEIGDPDISPEELNPLEMIDQTHKRGKQTYVGFDLAGNPIPRSYKGGRLPRSPNTKGKLDLLRAIETSSNPYFSLLAGDVLNSPEDLAKAAKGFSFGTKTGIALPAEISGQVPQDLKTNRTGLYSTAIGQHTLIVTPLQTAIMLSVMANGGAVMQPQIVRMHAGPHSRMVTTPQKKWEIPFPPVIRNLLVESMERVVERTQKESLGRLSRIYRDYPEAISDYVDLKDDLVGKTSTAEILEYVSLDFQQGTNMYKHVWFGGISFEDAAHEKPELVVVVYLRFGTYGKEAAPVAAQIVKKWREIKAAPKKM